MNLNTFSAQTINFVDDVMEFDYQQLWVNLVTIGAICAVIIGAARPSEERRLGTDRPARRPRTFPSGWCVKRGRHPLESHVNLQD